MDLQVKLLADVLSSISKSHDRREELTPKVVLWPPLILVHYILLFPQVL